MKVMYPGSFDPITNGHVDLIERASECFGEVVVAIMENSSKVMTFSISERVEMVEESIRHLHNVSVVRGTGLTVEFAGKIGCKVLIRGIRAVMDYEYELQQATANRVLDNTIETFFLVASPKYSFVSSSVAKTISKYSDELSTFVPDHVAKKLIENHSNK